MNVTVVGTGYVGLIAGLCFADFGNTVTCLDVVQEKINKLQLGVCPIYEPGAETLIARNLKAGRLRFTTEFPLALKDAEVVFITVGTPEDKDGNADLSYIFQVARMIAQHMQGPLLVVDKSTVPVGTSRKVYETIEQEQRRRGTSYSFEVASNPEFLREGKAIQDFMNPDRIVLGVASEQAARTLRRLYSAFERSNKPMFVTTPETAEMIKYASNAFLATKIGFINEVAALCEQVGANVQHVARAMGMDGRISSKFLHAGPGYGGSCFPKDTKALAATGRRHDAQMTIVESVIRSNEMQKQRAAQKIAANLEPGRTLAVLGLAFKPETDDVREAPAIEIIRYLLKNTSLKLRVYDPQAEQNARRELGEHAQEIVWCSSLEDSLQGSDAVAIITEWLEFRNVEYSRYPALKTVFDLRNTLIREEVEREGIRYFGTGL